MERTTVTSDDMTEEQAEAFRRAAGTRGVEAVVDWNGRPHVVTAWRQDDDVDEFTIEPIPRPFG